MTSILSGSLTTDGAGTSENLDSFGQTAFALTGKAIRLTMAIDAVSRINNLFFFVGTSSLANNLRWRFDADTAASKLAKSGEVFNVTLLLSEVDAAAGTFAMADGVVSPLTGFTDARLQATDDSGGAMTVDLLDAQLVDTDTNGYISITFDDCHESLMSYGYPIMRQSGMTGTVYAIRDLVGAAGRVSLASLQVLDLDAWEIAGHADTQTDHDSRYSALAGPAVFEDLTDIYDWLKTNFRDPDDHYSFSYPGGEYEDTTDALAIEDLTRLAGFASGRTTLADAGVFTHRNINAIPPEEPHRLYALSSISEQQNSSSPSHPDGLVATGGVLDKIAAHGGWLILVFHQIVDDTTGTAATTEITQSGFQTIIDGIAARSLTVAPVRDIWRPTAGATHLGSSRVAR